MILILFAISGGLLVFSSLEIRMRKRPGRVLGWLSVLVGVVLLHGAYVSLTWDDPVWLQAGTIAGTVAAVLLGNLFGNRLHEKGVKS